MLFDRPKPISDRIAEFLRDRIRLGYYDQIGRLPSESDLSEQMGVSRTTIRTALTMLASEGLIIRRQGDGTYINKRSIEVISQTRWEFTRLIRDSGRTPSIKLISETIRDANQEEARNLELIPEQKVLVLERLFLADNLPVIFSINVLSEALIRTTYPKDAWRENILDFVEKYCALRYSYNIVDISAIAIDEKIANYLGIKSKEPILLLREIFYDMNIPIFCASNYFNDKAIRMRFAQGVS